MEFSSETYNNVKLDTTKVAQDKIKTPSTTDATTLSDNTKAYEADAKKAANKDGRMDNEAFWNLSDIERSKVLQNGTVQDKIKVLIETGLSQEEIKKTLANSADFKALTKDSDSTFEAIYAEKKEEVANTNAKVDAIVMALNVASIGVMFIDGVSVKLTDMAAKKLIKEAIEEGLKISPEKIVSIAKVDGKIVWLEKGSSSAGLQHIIERHDKDFVKWGVESGSIANFVTNTIKTGKSIGTYGADGSVYKVLVNGETKYLNVVIGSNGYIVNSYPLGIKNLGGVIWK